tara:strand:- start:296 stop:958 length:663 start_codon:yes stop_codon:yes gene_type:complete
MKEFFQVFLNSLWIIVFLVLIWLIHILQLTFQINLAEFGILPRSFSGLIGIITSPLVHSAKDINHIINNSFPFMILGWTLFYFYKPIAWRILIQSWFFTGVFVWISARNAYHIGLSGVIYSLLFFIFFSGVFRKDNRLLTVALFVVFLYGSMVWGIFPYDWTISFESHLFGALTGIILAYFNRKEESSFKVEKTQWEIEEELGIEPPDLEGLWDNPENED